MDGVKVKRDLSLDILLVLHGMSSGQEGIAYIGTAFGLAPNRALEAFTTLKDQPKDYLNKVAKEVIKRGSERG